MIVLTDINLSEVYGKSKIQKWEENYDVFDNEDVRKWISHKVEQYSRNGKEPSKFNLTSYVKPFDDYCKFYKVNNPSVLLEEDVDTRNRRVMKYLATLLNDGANEATVKNSIQSRIKSFYSDRGKPITDGLTTVSSGVNKNEVILSKHDVKKIQAKLGAEYSLILKSQCLLGLRISDVLTTLKSGKYQIERYKEHYFIRRFKTRKEGVVINFLFFPTELTTMFQSLYKEDLTELDLTKILKTNRTKENSDEHTDIQKYHFLERIKEVAEEVGIEGNIKTHSFRKYFSSQIRKCKKLDMEFKEHLMGHKAQNLSRSYNNNLRDIEWFYKQWRHIEQLVCIDCEIYDRTNQEVLKLKEDKKKLEKQVEMIIDDKIELEKKLEKKEKQIEELKKSLKNKASKKDLQKLEDMVIQLTGSKARLNENEKLR